MRCQNKDGLKAGFVSEDGSLHAQGKVYLVGQEHQTRIDSRTKCYGVRVQAGPS